MALRGSLRREDLQRAVAAVGREEIAIKLNVPHHLLDAWLSGHATMPDLKFVTLTDILDKRVTGQDQQ